MKGDLFLKILFCSISSFWCSLISDYKYNVLSDALLWEELYLFPFRERLCQRITWAAVFLIRGLQCTQASNFFQDPNNEWM